MIRAFIAVELPEAVRLELGRLQSSCQATLGERWSGPGASNPIQWVKPESLHVTVKFLGSISEAQVSDIEEVLLEIGHRHQSFSLTLEGLGVFPNRQAPRVLWVGGSGSLTCLEAIVKEVDDRIMALGIPRESRAFHPHLTLARIKQSHRLFGTSLAETGLLARSAIVGTFQVSSLSLMKSVLHPSGPTYTTLCSRRLQDVS